MQFLLIMVEAQPMTVVADPQQQTAATASDQEMIASPPSVAYDEETKVEQMPTSNGGTSDTAQASTQD